MPLGRTVPVCALGGWTRGEAGRSTHAVAGAYMSSNEIQDILSTYIHALDFQSMVEDVTDFIQLSEQTVEDQYQRELEVETKATYPNAPPGYREHVLEGLEFRFRVSLPTRLRYAAIVAIATSLEWAVKLLNAEALEPVATVRDGTNPTVQVLRALSQRSGAPIEDDISIFEDLVQVRNCIAHDSGLTESFRHKEKLRAAVQRLGCGFSLRSFNLMGEQVWIEKEAIEALIPELKHAVVSLHRAMYEKNLLKGAA